MDTIRDEDKRVLEELLKYSKGIRDTLEVLKEDLEDIESILSTIKEYYNMLELVSTEEEFEKIEELKNIKKLIQSPKLAEIEKLAENIKELEATIAKLTE